MDGVQLPQGQSHFKEAVYFLPLVPRNSWYSFYRPRKDERLSRPWSHSMVLNTGPLDWETSILTTRPLLQKTYFPPKCLQLVVKLFFHRFCQVCQREIQSGKSFLDDKILYQVFLGKFDFLFSRILGSARENNLPA